jgi:hypothetical protein
MSMKPYDELPWWCQLLWPWFGPPGKGDLAKAGRLTAARHQAQEIISHEYDPPTPEDEVADDEDDEPTPDVEWPVVVDRNHPSWAEVDAEQQERANDPESG